jgi:NitT/TauT family transport system substrate-binding protein
MRELTRCRALVAASGFAAIAATIGVVRPARAASKVRLLTNWFAEAEHGGYYQAKGGPQMNNAQLLTGGDADLILGSDIQTLSAVEQGIPLVAVASTFQFDLQGIVAHPSVRSIGDLKAHPILIGAASHATFWPWLKERYGFTDDQAQPYFFTYQRFTSDPAVAQQGYITYDPFALRKAKIPANFFLLAKDGYPPYGSPLVTTRSYVQDNADVVARFVRASSEGWSSYLRDPAPANALITADNPKMGEDQLASCVATLRSSKALGGGDAATRGIGVMTDARWRKTRDFLVRAGLAKDTLDWRAAYTTQFCSHLASSS